MNAISNSLPVDTPLPTSLTNAQNLTALQGLSTDLESIKRSGTEQYEQVANDFESVFVSLMLKEMRNTLDSEEGGLFGSEGSDTFGGMFDMFMGQHIAKSNPLGVGDVIKSYLANSI